MSALPGTTADWYEKRHDELLQLLERAVSVSDAKRHKDKLQEVWDKCREDIFNFVLLGEFQDGKSTTLDTLCCGREVGPQGNGQIATSAVPISVESVKLATERPEGMDEWAELHFKTKEQIAEEVFLAFESLIGDSKSPKTGFLRTWAKSGKEDFCQKFDLDNPGHREEVRSFIEEEWGRYRAQRNLFGTSYRQRLAVLTQVVRFYGDDKHKSFRERGQVRVEDGWKYVAFPSNWTNRCIDGFSASFSFDECAFAFLDTVVLHVESATLEKIGCRVTDCPGLGASAYDSDVTRRALRKADGIWFVKRCEKQMGAADMGRMFDYVRASGCLGRTGMLLNLWKSHRKSTEPDGDGPSLVDYCKNQMQQEGFGFPMFWGNARLAFLAALGRRRIKNGEPFSEREKQRLAKMIKDILEEDVPDEDEELWVKAVEAANYVPRVKEVMGIDALDESSVEILWKASNFDVAIEQMLGIALTQRGKAILIDNGTKKALEILCRHEGELRSNVEEATRTADEFKRDYEGARKRLQEFTETSHGNLRNSVLVRDEEMMADHLAEDFATRLLGDELASELSEKLAEEVYNTNAGFTWSDDEYRKNVLRVWMPIVREGLECRFAKITEEDWWDASSNPHVRKLFRSIQDVNETIASGVKELAKTSRLLENLPVPTLGASTMMPVFQDAIASSLSQVIDNLRARFWQGLLSALKFLFGGFLLKWLGKGKKPADIIKEMSPKIKEQLEEAFRENSLLENARKLLARVFTGVQEDAIKEIGERIDALESAFEADCAEKRGLHDMAQADMAAKVAEQKRKQEEDITPLRKELEKFENEVQDELAQVVQA